MGCEWGGLGGGEVRAGLAEKRQLHHLFEGSAAAACGIIQFIYPGESAATTIEQLYLH